MTKLFEVAGGSIVGRDHVGPVNLLLGKNNQDAFAYHVGDDFICGVVCDGCSGGTHSEVGAKIGARLAIENLKWMVPAAFLTRAYSTPTSPLFWKFFKAEMMSELNSIIKHMGQSATEVVSNYFLFTMLGVYIDECHTVIFGIGDGVFAVNGELTQIGPFPGNEPPYLAYGGLVRTSLEKSAPELLDIKIHRVLPTDMVQSVLVGTDGVCDLIEVAERNMPGKQKEVGPLHQFWQEDCFFKNSDMVRRKLSLVNSSVPLIGESGEDLAIEHGLLPDDTTLVVARRKPQKEAL